MKGRKRARPLPPRGTAFPKSAAEQEKLRKKIQGLVAILEVALVRLRVEMERPGADLPRLVRVKENLDRTYDVCKRTLGRLEKALAIQAESLPPRRAQPMSCREYVELSTLEEFHRLRDLPPIRFDQIESVNLDELADRLACGA